MVLAACAAPEIPFDHSSSQDVKTIGIVTPAFSPKPSVVLASSVGQSLGLIGAMVDATMQSNRETDFKKLADSHGFAPEDVFDQALTESLEKQGYTVKKVPVKHDKAAFLDHYPPVEDTQIDAYLDVVVIGYGYIAAGISSSNPYRPAVIVKAKLVRAKDTSVLMQDQIFYNPVNTPKKTITLSPDPKYTFVDFDALMGDPDRAVEGMQVSLKESARTVGTLLH